MPARIWYAYATQLLLSPLGKIGSEAMATKPGLPATAPSDTPDEKEMRAQDCRAKAAYCKWVASISPDETLRKFYAKLSIEWEKEATK
jgi:hypothetical protein